MMSLNQEEVDAFLPEYKPYAALHPDNIVSMGTLALPEIFNEVMKAKDEVLKGSKKVILEVWKEWEEKFGRSYKPVESYRTEDAEVLFLAIGSMAETAEVAVDELRDKGMRIGLLKLRLWRPFPFEEIRNAVKGAKVVAVLDRAVSFGGPGGPVFSEVRSALYDEKDRPMVINEIIGLGGRDVPVGDFVKIAEKATRVAKTGPEEEYEIFGVRGS
jgi:pyruvate ferredoxin oxidoreductase alpha subunit